MKNVKNPTVMIVGEDQLEQWHYAKYFPNYKSEFDFSFVKNIKGITGVPSVVVIYLRSAGLVAHSGNSRDLSVMNALRQQNPASSFVAVVRQPSKEEYQFCKTEGYPLLNRSTHLFFRTLEETIREVLKTTPVVLSPKSPLQAKM